MTNDVRTIVRLMLKKAAKIADNEISSTIHLPVNSTKKLESDLPQQPIKPRFSVGNIVISKDSGQRLIVIEENMGNYLCKNEQTGEIDRVYDDNELISLEK